MITIALYFAVFLSVLLPHMDVHAADSTISNLPSATTPLAGTEVVPIVQSGVTKKVGVSNVGRLSTGSTGAVQSANGSGGFLDSGLMASSGALVEPRKIYNVIYYGADPTGATDSYAAIAAAQTAAAATCGVVFYPGGTYKVLSALTVAACVTHEGVGWALSTIGNTVTTGSILVGDGSNSMFVWNNVALGSTPPEPLATKLSGVKIRHLAMKDFKRAIHFGDRFNVGLFEGELTNLFVQDGREWGIYCENCSLLTVTDIHVAKVTPGGIGAIAFWSSQNGYNHGNSNFRNILVETYSDLVRCISFIARDNSRFNDNNIDGIQCNTSNLVYTQAATMNATDTITVSDATKYPVDMPVTFSATVNGFFAGRAYFVVPGGNGTTTLKVADMLGGAAITATGSAGGINIITYGWPALEIIGRADGDGSKVQPMVVSGVDLEGRSTCLLVIQNAQVHLDLNYIDDGGQGTTNAAGLCARVSTGSVASTEPISYDSDYNTGLFSKGVIHRSSDSQPMVNRPLLGNLIDKGQRPYSTVGPMVQQGATALNIPDDTTEDIAQSVTIYGRQLGPSGCLRYTVQWSAANNGNAKTVRVRFGGIAGTVYVSHSLANAGGLTMEGMICNRAATGSQVGSLLAGTTDTGIALAYGKITSSVDTTADTTLVFTGQKAVGSDALTLERFHVELFPGQ